MAVDPASKAPEGQEEWNQIFGGAGFDKGADVRQTSDGGYVIAGQTESFGNGNPGAGSSDVWLVKTDWAGVEEWSRTFGGIARERATSVAQTADGGFFIGGDMRDSFDGTFDAWLIRTDAAGELGDP